MATNLANAWLARLQRDATLWTKPDAEDATTINLSGTTWLSQLDACKGVFCSPPMPAAADAQGQSPAFDMFGRDLPKDTTDAWYCAQYRLTWIASPGTASPYKLTSLMRAEVRVYWNRLEANPIGDCSSPPPEAIPTDKASTWHMVYAATSIRPNPRR
jgi:hypothetical protein